MSVIQYLKDIALGYEEFSSLIPSHYNQLIIIFIFSILISLYALFIWKFCSSLSKRDLFELNLARYNRSEHPVAKKAMAILLYALEYIVILPFVIFFWFAVLSIIILLASEQQAIQILTIAAAIVASVRILSYYNEDLSKDISKLFPLTLLAILVFTPGFFSLSNVISRLTQIPSLITNILYFLLLIVALELILRVLSLMFDPESRESF